MAKKKLEGITFIAHISPDCSPETKKALSEMLTHLAEQIESGGLTQLAVDDRNESEKVDTSVAFGG